MPIARPAAAQAPDRPAAATEDPEDVRLSEARTQVRALTVRLTPSGKSEPAVAELLATPLMHYSDQQRGFTDSTLWVWQLAGRPVLFSKLERLFNAAGETSGWQFCCTPTIDDTVEIQSDRRLRWRSRKAALKWQDLDEAPLPAAGAPGRLLQMKSLAARFVGEIENTPINDREQMRLLSRPLHRYQSPAQDTLDAAVFGITSKGTNPDALLVIEAVSMADGQSKWRFGIIGMTGDALLIRLEDKVVFEKAFTNGPGDHRSWVWFLAPSVVTPDVN
jgi:hypothetical protein